MIRPLLALAILAAIASPAHAAEEAPDYRDPATAYMLGLVPFYGHGAAAYVGMTRFGGKVPGAMAGEATWQLVGDVALVAGAVILPGLGSAVSPSGSAAGTFRALGGVLALGVPLVHLGNAQRWADLAAERNRKMRREASGGDE